MYDAFIYNQENYYLSEDGKQKDCIVKVENLRDYVFERLDNHFKRKMTLLPSGTIVSQYCNLDKWFCVKTDNTIDDFNAWQGYRPAMISTASAPYSFFNTIQGKACRGETFLYYDGDSNDALTSEMAPDFKKGYVLCNGDPLTIELCPSYIQTANTAHRSLDLFLDLFYTLGYYYHNNEALDSNNQSYIIAPPIRRVKPAGNIVDNNKTYTIYSFLRDDINGTKRYYSEQAQDYDVIYAIDMAIITAFLVLDGIFANNALQYFNSVDEVIEALKAKELPREYIFNAISPDKNFETNTFNYVNGDKSITMNIGKEINSFTDTIPYYVYDETRLQYRIVPARICDLAEVRHMAKLFLEKKQEDYWQNFKFTFNVPKLFTSTDEDVNLAESYRLNNKKVTPLPQKVVGLFAGSNGLIMADSINIPYKNKTLDLTKSVNTFVCNYNLSLGLSPHAHAIAKGDLRFD